MDVPARNKNISETKQIKNKLDASLNDMKTWMQVARNCLGLSVSPPGKSDLISHLFCVMQLFVYFVVYCICDECCFLSLVQFLLHRGVSSSTLRVSYLLGIMPHKNEQWCSVSILLRNKSQKTVRKIRVYL